MRTYTRNIAAVAALILFLVSQNCAQVVTRQPYLQIVTPTSVVVRWDTDSTRVGTVHYGASLASLADSASEPAAKSKHEVTITGLSPQQKYYYSVTDASGGSENQYVVTAPTADSAPSTRIWVVSDFGQTPIPSDDARRVLTVNVWKEFNNNDLHADFMLSLGDQSEIDTDTQLRNNYFTQLQDVVKTTPLYTIPGNHEAKDLGAVYKAVFTSPANAEAGGYPSGTEDYYSFNYGNIHVVGLTVESNVSITGAQTTWLENDLAGNHSDWLIAVMHRPMHSAGYHKSDGDAFALAQKTNWLPLLEEAGVDLVLAGHNHLYERSYLLDNLTGNSTSITEANKIDTTLGRMDAEGAYQKIAGQPHQGTIFINCEAGGSSNDSSYLTDPFSFFPVAYAGETYEGSLVIDVEDSSRMDVRFLCDEVNIQGSHVWDHFTIIKTFEPTSVDDRGREIPETISIANYPNPFNPATKIVYYLPQRGHVKIVVYDLIGRAVATLVNGPEEAGTHTLEWRGRDESGNPLVSGLYIAQIQSASGVKNAKMMLLR